MNSIRRQLTRRLIVSLVGLLGAGLAAIYAATWNELVEAADFTLRSNALAVTALTESEHGQVQFDFSPDFLAAYRARRPRHFFEVRDPDHVLTRSPSLVDADLPWREGGTPDRPKYYNVTLPNGRPGRAAAFAFATPADRTAPTAATPRLQIVVASDRTDLNETLGWLFGAVIGCGALLFAAVFLIVPRVLARGLAPLEALGEQAARIDAESLATRFAADRLPAELQPIGRRLNDLLARLEASFERERRFSADLAHELRTPLAELRNLAECALKWPDARDPATDTDVLAIAAQMEALATRMLTLARGERSQLAVQLAPVDVAALAHETWQPFAARADARGVRATFALPVGTVRADAVLLRSILTNLFDNAAGYAPTGSEVRIAAESSAHGYALSIANPAGTLTADEVARCFDRFWRQEAARSGGEHVGLGLNLARTFATAMGWSLTASLDDSGWIVFTLAGPDSTAGDPLSGQPVTVELV